MKNLFAFYSFLEYYAISKTVITYNIGGSNYCKTDSRTFYLPKNKHELKNQTQTRNNCNSLLFFDNIEYDSAYYCHRKKNLESLQSNFRTLCPKSSAA